MKMPLLTRRLFFLPRIAADPGARRLLGTLAVAVAASLSGVRVARAQTPGSLDPGFNAGTDDSVPSVAVQPDGKLVLGGLFANVNGVARRGVARLNADGSLDAGFTGPAGINKVYALQPDGKVVTNKQNGIARLNANGSLDTSFGTTIGSGSSNGLVVQADGRMIVVGAFAQVNGVPRDHIARLNPDGTLETTFTPGTDLGIASIAVQTDGKLLLGGSFTQVNGTGHTRLARLNADGSVDGSFSPVADGNVSTLAVQGDGKILVAGSFTQVNRTDRLGVARLNADGTLDRGFNVSVNGSVYTLAPQADGKIVLGGSFTQVNGVSHPSIVRLNADGATDNLFDASVTGNGVSVIATQPDGKLVLGGTFTQVNGAAHANIARINGRAAPPPVPLPVQGVALLSPPPGITVAAGQPLDVYAQVNAAPEALSRLEFFVGDNAAPAGTPDLSLGASIVLRDHKTWTPTQAGNFHLTVVATDFGGQSKVATVPISVTAAPGPQVALLGGLDGRVLAADSSVTLFAAGVDAQGNPLVSIQFYADGVPLGPPVAPRAEHPLPGGPVRRASGLPPGSTSALVASAQSLAGKLITAVGRSASGSAAVSAPATLATQTTTRGPLTSSILPPAGGNSLFAGRAGAASVVVAADEPAGRVQRVELYANSTKVGESGAAPFRFDLPALSVGAYVLTAIATDDLGVSAQSAPFTLVAVPPPPGVVTVIPTGDGTVMENASKTKVVFVREGGDLSADLLVTFKLKGTAVSGVDYKPFPTLQVIIPAGLTSVSLKVKPIDDAIANGTRTVVIQAKAPVDGSYTVGSPKKATVEILDND